MDLKCVIEVFVIEQTTLVLKVLLPFSYSPYYEKSVSLSVIEDPRYLYLLPMQF